jgi:dihydroorotate dehydrogenase (fumarate)
MLDLSTKYLGLTLKNPIIVGSSGLTNSVEKIKELEKNGAAAVVLKSIFEEEILLETQQQLNEAEKNAFIYTELSETLDYIDLHVKEDRLNEYLKLIRDAKKSVLIPVIASINCVSAEDWVYFAGKIESAGADALELNIFLNPADTTNKEFEKAYFNIIMKVKSVVSIPISLKISKYFTRLALTANALSDTGIAGMTMFNRFYRPDIDIDKMELTSGNIFTSRDEQLDTLRWVAILSQKINIDIAASTGIHEGSDVIKMLLAGADAVQVVSSIYLNGPEQIQKMLAEIEDWMSKRGFNSISQFRAKVGKLYQSNASAFERMQFMKHFSEIG